MAHLLPGVIILGGVARLVGGALLRGAATLDAGVDVLGGLSNRLLRRRARPVSARALRSRG